MRTWLAVVDTPSCTELPLNWPIWGELWSGPSLVQKYRGGENKGKKWRVEKGGRQKQKIISFLYTPVCFNKLLESKSRSACPMTDSKMFLSNQESKIYKNVLSIIQFNKKNKKPIILITRMPCLRHLLDNVTLWGFGKCGTEGMACTEVSCLSWSSASG